MYRIIGADGKEYGPISIDQFRAWVAQGRVNGQTKVQTAASTEWVPAAQVSELASLFAASAPRPPAAGPPPILRAPRTQRPQQGLAVLSFVLGLVSFVFCLNVLTGIPAIIVGHIARSRAARLPARYGGVGFATAGLVLGYVSILFSLIIAAMVLPLIAKNRMAAGPRPVLNNCQNNLRQIGLAFKVWELEHNDQFPFNVSTNSGGSLELCQPGPDGFDKNAIAHFLVISNELSTPGFLVCPTDRTRHAARSFEALQSENISYRLHTGTNVNSDNPQQVLAVCPIHGNELFCDGNVRNSGKSRQ